MIITDVTRVSQVILGKGQERGKAKEKQRQCGFHHYISSFLDFVDANFAESPTLFLASIHDDGSDEDNSI